MLNRAAVFLTPFAMTRSVCDASEIPDDIVIDLRRPGSAISIHISPSPAQGTISAITERDFTIATIVSPSGSCRSRR